MKLRFAGTVAIALLLGGCGYHLVGHGGGPGAVPADVETLSIAGNGEAAQVLPLFRQRLSGERYQLVKSDKGGDKSHHAQLLINISRVSFRPSAYDATGVATQYRMIYSGSLQLERAGKTEWQSGVLSQQGDVFVSGGPASTEAARERLVEDLRKAWVSDALGRLRSSF